MIVSQRLSRMMGLRVVDIYFSDAIDNVQFVADIGVILQAATPIPGASPFYTLKIDLRKSSDEILSEMNKTNRYKIRRAEERDPIHIEITTNPTDDDINTYADFFDRYFALIQGFKPCNRNRLRSLRGHGALALTQAKHDNGDVLAVHAHVVDHHGGRVRLLYSASFYNRIESSVFRNLIGRANRLLHWREILRFQELGFKYYDFGGIGGPDASEKQRRIAEFKLSFGGQQCIEYNTVIGKTMLGKMALAVKKLIKR